MKKEKKTSPQAATPMDRQTSSPTLETIARTIDEFSFIFTGFPPRLPPSVKQRHYRTIDDNHHLPTNLSNVYPSPSPRRDFVFQSFERKDKPPLPPPHHHHLQEGRPEEAESTTPPHIHYDSDPSAISAKSCGSRESGVPSSSSTESESQSESKGYPRPPSTDTSTTAELEMMNHRAHPPTTKKRYQLPKDYTKLPHFHPPRFSRRLRNLVAERRRPMRLHLVPVVREPVQDQEKGQAPESYWVITSSDVEAAHVKPRRSWGAMNKRILLLVIFATLFGGVIMLVLAMALGWTR